MRAAHTLTHVRKNSKTTTATRAMRKACPSWHPRADASTSTLMPKNAATHTLTRVRGAVRRGWRCGRCAKLYLYSKDSRRPRSRSCQQPPPKQTTPESRRRPAFNRIRFTGQADQQHKPGPFYLRTELYLYSKDSRRPRLRKCQQPPPK